MGEEAKETLKLRFGNRLSLEFHGARITSDAGLMAFRELDGAVCHSHVEGDHCRAS